MRLTLLEEAPEYILDVVEKSRTLPERTSFAMEKDQKKIYCSGISFDLAGFPPMKIWTIPEFSAK